MAVTVAVVGAGRMGSIVAAQLPDATRKIIVDSNVSKARRLAESVGGEASDNIEITRQADIVALVLPAPAINDVVGQLVEIATRGCIILNMATTAHVDLFLKKKHKEISVIDARIIGHALSMVGGEPGLVVVACEDQSKFNRIRQQFPGFQSVVQGDADLVEEINQISSIEGLKAALTVKERLAAMDVPEEWVAVAVRTICAGIIKAYVKDDLGHFARELVRQLREEIRSKKMPPSSS